MLGRSTDTTTADISRMALFAGCSPRQLRRIRQLGETRRVRSGELLMLERFRGEEFHIILAGRARVAHGGEPPIILSAGDFLGEIGLLEDVDRTATVVAETPMRLLSFDAEAFERLMASDTAVAERVRAVARARVAPTGADSADHGSHL